MSVCSYARRALASTLLRTGAALWLGFAWQNSVAEADSARPPLTSPQYWYSLSADEAKQGRVGEVEGTVVCYDLAWGQFYLHDGTSAMYLNPHGFTNEFELGQKVKIRGQTAWDGTNAFLTKLTAVISGRQDLPLGQLLSLSQLTNSHGQWIETSGTVRVAESSRERVTLVLKDGLVINTVNLDLDGIEMRRQYKPDLGKINVEKHKVLQIMVNLIGNAKHARAESAHPRKLICLSAERNDGKLLITVQDNGIGIAPENLARIFNHGFTTRTQGHGFGLHSGALAAKELGGKLTARSEGLGQGASFILELPLAPTSRH